MVAEAFVNTPAAWSERAAIEPGWCAVGWSEDGQRDRFDAVLEALAPEPGERLLDFGCGTGALVRLLDHRVGYVGVDWAAGMLERARRDHPGVLFVHPPVTARFDLVACVGTFNVADGWSKEQTWCELEHLWRSTGCRTLAASLYAGLDERCLHYGDTGQLHAVASAIDSEVTSEVIPFRGNDVLLVMRR